MASTNAERFSDRLIENLPDGGRVFGLNEEICHIYQHDFFDAVRVEFLVGVFFTRVNVK
jgi:hypothetical protein